MKLEQMQMNDNPADLDLSPREIKRYSLIRAANAILAGDWSKAGFELECSNAIADRLKREPRGFYPPEDWLFRAPPMGVGKVGEGLELVGEDRLGALGSSPQSRDAEFLPRCTVLTGLRGNVSIPYGPAHAASGWLADDTVAPTESSASTAQVTMSPKIFASAVGVTRLLAKQSSPSVDDFIRRAFLSLADYELEGAIVAGTGASGQPAGIVTVAGVNAIVAAAPTLDNMVAMEEAVHTGGGSVYGDPCYVIGHAEAMAAKKTETAAGGGIMVLQDGMINGYPAFVHPALDASGTMVFGNLRDCIVGIWGGIDMVVTVPASDAPFGGYLLTGYMDADVGILHPENFAKATDI